MAINVFLSKAGEDAAIVIEKSLLRRVILKRNGIFTVNYSNVL